MSLPPFDSSWPAYGCVRVAFKRLAHADVLANRVACWATSRAGDAPALCDKCHCELVVDVTPGCAVRIGVASCGGEGPDAVSLSFVRRTTEEQMLRLGYVLVLLPAPRAAERLVLEEGLRAEGSPFSLLALLTHPILGRGLGLRSTWSEGWKPRDGVVCSNLTVLLLQRAAIACGEPRRGGWTDVVCRLDAARESPNSLMRALSEATDARMLSR